MEFLANLLASVGEAIAETSSNACILWLADEPVCPESLVK